MSVQLGTAWNLGRRKAEWERIGLPVQETRDTQVQFLGQEDMLEKEMAIHSSVLAWEIPWTEEPDKL